MMSGEIKKISGVRMYPVSKEEFDRIEGLNSRPLEPHQLAKIEFLTREIIAITHHISQFCPPSRERSLALTSIEECKMWCSRAISLEGRNDRD